MSMFFDKYEDKPRLRSITISTSATVTPYREFAWLTDEQTDEIRQKLYTLRTLNAVGHFDIAEITDREFVTYEAITEFIKSKAQPAIEKLHERILKL